MMKTRIFAYGSNMFTPRMRHRVFSARVLTPARLAKMTIEFNKIGFRDGTGKANLVESPDESVYGVIYEMDSSHLTELDRCELGYRRITFDLIDLDGKPWQAEAYMSKFVDDRLKPSQEYKDFVVNGALEHNFPLCYIQKINQFPVQEDGH